MLGFYILLLILGYCLYKLIFSLVIPFARTYRVIRRGFAQMQEEARPQQQQHWNGAPKAGGAPKRTPNWDKMGDYIDFEEVK